MLSIPMPRAAARRPWLVVTVLAGLWAGAAFALPDAARLAASTTPPMAPLVPLVPPLVAAPIAPSYPPHLVANSHIELEIVDGVSSRTAARGMEFRMRVTAPVVVDGAMLVPAGTLAVGQVVHAQRKGMGGKPGELIVAARRLDLPGGPLKLRASLGASGAGRQGAAVATTIAFGVLGLLVTGKDTELPAGTAVSARTAEEYIAPVTLDAGPAGPNAASNP
jgi:hypothetical protein